MNDSEKDRILGNLVRAVQILEACPKFGSLIPEVRVNLAYAFEGATDPADVAAIDGRITRVRGRPFAAGFPAFGASDHMARLLVETMKRAPGLRAGINFRWSEELVMFFEVHGQCPAKIDRSAEPDAMSRADGDSMPWKIRRLVEKHGRVPRLFYETAATGKEPLFVLLGEDAVQVAQEVVEIAVKAGDLR